MKNIFKYSAFIVVLLAQCVANAGILKLQLDSSTYTLGQKSLMRVYATTKSNNPDDEIVYSSKLNGEDQEIMSLDSRIGFGLSNELSVEGTNEWIVEAFIQNKKLVERYEMVILSYTRQNVELAEMISYEVDPNQRAILQEVYDRNSVIISHADLAISEQRRKIAQETIQFEVSATKSKSLLQSLFRIDMDQDDRTYAVGESAIFTAQMLNDVTGVNGIHEILMSGEVEASGSSPALTLSLKKVDDKTFRFTTGELVADDVGTRRFKFDIKTRPKFQADSIRDAMKYAKQKEGFLNHQISVEQDELTKSYLDLKKQALSPFISNLTSHLSEIVEPLFENQGARFDVVQ